MRRVVITGLGIYSCLGKTLDEVKTSLYNGTSGIIFDAQRKEMGFRSALTGWVEEPDLKQFLKRKERMGIAQQGKYAYMSTRQALEQANIDEAFFDEHEVGLLIGNDTSTLATMKGVDTFREKKDSTLIGSSAIFQSMNSTVNMSLATIFRVRGINMTISSACASGSHSVGMGYLLIKNGYQDTVICGGAQEINPYAMCSFDGISAFSINEQEPTKASRPFDKHRDGLVPGGGAATLILESYESAKARGAHILGEIVAYGFSSNGTPHLSVPNVDGPKRAIEKSIEMAGLQPGDIDYVNAHATSTPIGDINEAKAIAAVFGDKGVDVSSTKSLTGHECWMAGASELVYSMLMMQHNFVAPNLNFSEPDEGSERLNIVAKTKEKDINIFLSNSFGFGGTNSSIIVKKMND